MAGRDRGEAGMEGAGKGERKGENFQNYSNDQMHFPERG